ncbi:hypothetical protein P9139_04510 [Curtobacterium flaccumfaciens]|nr:hypothetical protein P9139_04510 [Curtobacterium flaccumfaciens]
MSDREWVQAIRHEQSILSLPFGLGWTIDVTQTLTALAAAGMPARVEAFDRLRFDDGRSGFLSTPNPTATINDDGTRPNATRTSSSCPVGRKAASCHWHGGIRTWWS